MSHTFEELVHRQRAADEVHTRVQELRDTYGSPTAAPWSETQTDTYETAWRAWRDLARDAQSAVTEHARAEERPRSEVEAEVKRAARERPADPGPEEPEAGESAS